MSEQSDSSKNFFQQGLKAFLAAVPEILNQPKENSLTSSDEFNIEINSSEEVEEVEAINFHNLSEIRSSEEIRLDFTLNEVKRNYPTDFWSYLDGNHHKLVPYMPSRQDYERLLVTERRSQIWNYFFRLELRDVGKPQKIEISQLKRRKKLNASAYVKKKALLEQEIEDIQDTGLEIKGTSLVDKTYTQGAIKLQEELEVLAEAYKNWVAEVDERIEFLNSEIKKLRHLIPPVPSDTVVHEWLREDIDRLKREVIRSAAVGTSLVEITAYNNDGEDVIVDNPIFLISPGELQSPEMIPPAYIPPFDLTGEIYKASQPETFSPVRSLATYINSNQLAVRFLPKPIPDRAKHLLARRKAITDEGYKILFGVYYIQAFMISKDMLTLTSFFFDFITGKTVADKTIEQYYKDIVAIEQSKEPRTIPLSYTDVEKNLEIEDAPAVSLVFQGGDRRTLTLVNQDYFAGIAEELEDYQSLSRESNHYIEKSVDEARLKANSVISVIRKCLREHKR